MAFSLWNLFKAIILCSNSVAILHEKRFLRKYGWDQIDASEGQTMKNQVIGLLLAVQYLRIPLIFANILVIIIELLVGGA